MPPWRFALVQRVEMEKAVAELKVQWVMKKSSNQGYGERPLIQVGDKAGSSYSFDKANNEDPEEIVAAG
ncbi:hypothetical protein E2C01_061148 [Portunus trituberculatus]|uniref:Uncharacterized protein n=1 Tax=Portunus trituberculatus TaxID=210409 RepID=A0A5B7HDL0_PORTR|nr:hypothetical protein [Portunus trituberculatus]